jgi:hypothetical protein
MASILAFYLLEIAFDQMFWTEESLMGYSCHKHSGSGLLPGIMESLIDYKCRKHIKTSNWISIAKSHNFEEIQISTLKDLIKQIQDENDDNYFLAVSTQLRPWGI